MKDTGPCQPSSLVYSLTPLQPNVANRPVSRLVVALDVPKGTEHGLVCEFDR